mgnify:CR=1 FL=1
MENLHQLSILYLKNAINQFDLSLFDSFEIHITKKNFKETFGPEKRPSKEDFLWFCEINRMFIVEHAQQYRGFNNNAIYWKIMLKKYNILQNKLPMILMSDPAIQTLGAKEGDIIKIIRNSPTNKKAEF